MEFLMYNLSRKRSFHRRVKHLDEYVVQFAYKQAARRHRATQHTSSLILDNNCENSDVQKKDTRYGISSIAMIFISEKEKLINFLRNKK